MPKKHTEAAPCPRKEGQAAPLLKDALSILTLLALEWCCVP